MKSARMQKDFVRKLEEVRSLVRMRFPSLDVRQFDEVIGKLGHFHYDRKKFLVMGKDREVYDFLLEKGVDLYYVQRSLGHVDIHTTQIYAYISNSDLQNKINLAFGRKKEKRSYGEVNDPVNLLKLKFASGEIGVEEFRERLELLGVLGDC